VISGTDPLDGKDFNPVDYINALFPSEQVCLRLTIIYMLDKRERKGTNRIWTLNSLFLFFYQLSCF